MEIIKLATVFGLGMVELWVAIPTGLVLGLHPVVTGVIAAIGAIIGVLIVLVLGENIRNWVFLRYFGENDDDQHGRIYHIWIRYGVVGLGLLAPLLFGAPLGTILGIIFGAQRWRLFFWIIVGIFLWSVLLTMASRLGLLSIEALMH